MVFFWNEAVRQSNTWYSRMKWEALAIGSVIDFTGAHWSDGLLLLWNKADTGLCSVMLHTDKQTSVFLTFMDLTLSEAATATLTTSPHHQLAHPRATRGLPCSLLQKTVGHVCCEKWHGFFCRISDSSKNEHTEPVWDFCYGSNIEGEEQTTLQTMQTALQFTVYRRHSASTSTGLQLVRPTDTAPRTLS